MWNSFVNAATSLFYSNEKIGILPPVLLSFFLGRLTSRDAAIRKAIGDDVASLNLSLSKFVLNFSKHQGGTPPRPSKDLKESRILLANDLEMLKILRTQIGRNFCPKACDDLELKFQRWWSVATGDKGIITSKTYAFTAEESVMAKEAFDEFSAYLTRLRMRILRGKVKFRS